MTAFTLAVPAPAPMTIALHVLTAIGLAIACGLRPFLATFLFGVMASLDVFVNVTGTNQAFMESPAFIAAAGVLLVLSLVFHGYLARPAGGRVMEWAGRILGALLFAGAMANTDAATWIWVVAGVLVAGFTQLAVGDTLTGARERLGAEHRGGLPIYLELVAGLAAVLAIVAPPVTLVYIAFLVRLGMARRRRAGEKYAGLRSLR
jgi:hypothetical protein